MGDCVWPGFNEILNDRFYRAYTCNWSEKQASRMSEGQEIVATGLVVFLVPGILRLANDGLIAL